MAAHCFICLSNYSTPPTWFTGIDSFLSEEAAIGWILVLLFPKSKDRIHPTAVRFLMGIQQVTIQIKVFVFFKETVSGQVYCSLNCKETGARQPDRI